MLSGSHERFERSMGEFIRTDLELGITFASLALDSKTEEGRQKCRKNARKTYDSARHFWKEHPGALTPAKREAQGKVIQMMRKAAGV